MLKQILIAAAAFALVVAVFVVYEVGVESEYWQPITRPSGVSSEARYVPNIKGSAWIDCTIDRGKDVDVCRAWDETGRVVARGNFRLDGENRAATAKELQPTAVKSYHDHPELSWICLREDKTLVPVNDAGAPLERFEVHIR